MSERFFNWERRPAITRKTPEGGIEGLFISTGSQVWSKASPVEILESGQELSRGKFLETFPDLPAWESAPPTSKPSAELLNRDALRAKLLTYPGATESSVERGLTAYDERAKQKFALMERAHSNALAEASLDRMRYPRPPGWRSVFFYPGSIRPRNMTLFWLALAAAITWFWIAP